MYSYELTIFSFRTIKTGVHFRNFSVDRNVFNFAQAHLLKTQEFLFLVLECFSRFRFEKNSTPKRSKLFDSIIPANEIAECNKLLNKTKTVKHRCEKSKCRIAICLKKNSWSNSFSSLTKTWNFLFECLSIKISHNHNLFLLILFLCLKSKRSDSNKVLVFLQTFLA